MMFDKPSDARTVFDLHGRTALVTGAARGNGRAIAEGLASVGVHVVLADVLAEALPQVACGIRASGGLAVPVAVDLLQHDDLVRLVDQALNELGRIDILVNCAGVTHGAPSQHYPDDAWDRTLGVNLVAAFRLSKLVAQHMIAQRFGRIINVTSIGAVLGFPANPAYQASKAALQQLTRALATDWAKYNIRVNNLCPGYFKTAMTEKSYADPEIRQNRSARCMLRRWGEPHELVGPVIFLASEASSYMTGSDLFIDGGFARTGLTEGQ